MLQRRAKRMGLKLVIVAFRITKNNLVEIFNRSSVRPCRNPAINGTIVVNIFIRQVKRRIHTQFEPGSRVNAKTIPVIEITMIVQAFVKRINAKSRVLTD